MTRRKIFNAFRAFVFSYSLFSVLGFLVVMFVATIIHRSIVISDFTNIQLLKIFAIHPWIFGIEVWFSGFWLFGMLMLIAITGYTKVFYDSINKIEGENS